MVGTTVGAFIPCCRDISAAGHSFHSPLAAEVAVPLAVGISCREGRILHGAGQELLKLFLEKPCLAELRGQLG